MVFRSQLVALIILLLAGAQSVQAVTVNDELYQDQWYLDKINVEAAWPVATGAGVIVAVLDSGVATDHPDIKANIWTNPGEVAGDDIDNDSNGFVDDVHGWDFVDEDSDPSPESDDLSDDQSTGHGTAIAGIIAATTDNNIGMAGVARDARVMPIRVLDSQGSGSSNDVARAVTYAVANGAQIINLSLVGYRRNSAVEDILAWAWRQGVVTVAAAGNGDEDNVRIDLDDTPAYPACIDNVLTVGSIGRTGVLSPFSNYGSCLDVVAPGEKIASLGIEARSDDSWNYTYITNWNGTSLATAVVSGALAVVASVNHDAGRDQWISALINTARSVEEQNEGFDGELGAGQIDLAAAVGVDYSTGGELVKLASYPAVYYVRDGVRRLFSTEAIYWMWYTGQWSDQPVRIISQQDFDQLASGSNIVARPGYLVKFNGRDQVHLAGEGGILHKIDTTVFEARFINQSIISLPIGFEPDYLVSDSIIGSGSPLPDGAVLTDGFGANYLLDRGAKRLITTSGWVANNFSDDIILRSQDIGRYITGPVLDSAESRLLPYKLK